MHAHLHTKAPSPGSNPRGALATALELERRRFEAFVYAFFFLVDLFLRSFCFIAVLLLGCIYCLADQAQSHTLSGMFTIRLLILSTRARSPLHFSARNIQYLASLGSVPAARIILAHFFFLFLWIWAPLCFMGQLSLLPLSVGIPIRALQKYSERPPSAAFCRIYVPSGFTDVSWCAVQATRGATHPARMSHAILGVDPSLHVLLCSPALCIIVAILPLNEYVPHILYTYTPAISHMTPAAVLS
jgi:hypothetical protein